MAGKSQFVEVVISELDWYIINKVKELRKQRGVSQSELSVEMGFSEKLIGSVENPTLTAKFNIRHLNLIALALKCSLWELLPEMPVKNDLMKVKIRRVSKPSKSGNSTSKVQFEVIEIKAVKSR